MEPISDADLGLLLLIRHLELALLRLFAAGQVGGTVHTCLGQEHVPVALAALVAGGMVFSNHRGHGHYLAHTGDPQGLLAEILGREGAPCHGVGGSQHLRSGGFRSTGVQGQNLPVAVGAALHAARNSADGLATVYIGDGTFGEGAVYEALNLAALWQVPLLVVAENNGIAQSTPVERAMAGTIAGRLADRHADLYLLGEDIADPYGGAFGVARGLSTRHPHRVMSKPISESGILGVSAGLALCGDRVIVEIMFGDFATLAFDQIVNFAAKSVTMYGRTEQLRLVIRCPVGGHRGYGPTHSQSLQKHFIGVPNLTLYELSLFHDPMDVLERALERSEPAIVFEPKDIYSRQMHADGRLPDPDGRMTDRLCYEVVDSGANWVHVHPSDPGHRDGDPDTGRRHSAAGRRRLYRRHPGRRQRSVHAGAARRRLPDHG